MSERVPRQPVISTTTLDPVEALRQMWLDTVREGRPPVALRLAYVAAAEERDRDEVRPRYRSRQPDSEDRP